MSFFQHVQVLAHSRKLFTCALHKIVNAHLPVCKIANNPQARGVPQRLEYFRQRSLFFCRVICHVEIPSSLAIDLMKLAKEKGLAAFAASPSGWSIAGSNR